MSCCTRFRKKGKDKSGLLGKSGGAAAAATTLISIASCAPAKQHSADNLQALNSGPQDALSKTNDHDVAAQATAAATTSQASSPTLQNPPPDDPQAPLSNLNSNLITTLGPAKDSTTTSEPTEQAIPVTSNSAPWHGITAKKKSQSNIAQHSTDKTQLPSSMDNSSPVQLTVDLLQDLWEVALTKMDKKDRTRLAKFKTGNQSVRKDIDLVIEHASTVLAEEAKAKWKPAINKILDGAQKFKSLVDSGMKFDTSGYGAIAWSALSFGLQIAINGKEVREFVFQSSEAITQLIARYAGYEILYRGSAKPSDACRKFEERLVDVYKAILVYMGTLEGYLQDGALLHQVKAFLPAAERTISSNKKSIDKADNDVKEWLPILKAESDNNSFSKLERQISDLMRPVYQLNQRLESIQGFFARRERQEVLDWLPEAQKESVHADIRNKPKIKNPGKWLLDMESFQEWQNSKVSCGLWLSGALGTGKTILTSTVITHIAKLYGNTSQGAMAYYYCSGTANARTQASDVLGNILRQLASTDAGLDTLKVWEAENRRGDLTNEALGELLHDIVELNDISQTTIIIDALDEADEDSFSDVMETLELLLNEPSGLVKVFISSRPEDHINNSLEAWPKIDVEPEFTKDDIETYVESQVDKRQISKKKIKEELRAEVKAFLKDRAHGMFRYIEMSVRWICTPSNPYEVRQAMKELPTDLIGVYRELFVRISDDRPLRQELARRTISWIIGAQNQLRATELTKALSSNYGEYQADMTVEDIVSSCHHLVIFNKSSDIIEFGHFSVVEFIRNERKAEYSQGSVHSLVSYLCLNAMWEVARVNDQGLRLEYIGEYVHSLTDIAHGTDEADEDELPRKPRHLSRSFVTFWCYATNYWAFHCQSSGADSGSTNMWDAPLASWCAIRQAIHRLPFAERSNASLGINSIGHRIPEKSAHTFSEWLFMVSCAFGLYSTLVQLIHNSKELLLFRSITTGVSGFHWAARWGHLKTVESFSRSYPTINLQDNAGWTPLAYAICGKHLAIVELLLSKNADPKALSSGGVSLHHLAMEQKFDDGAAALIKYGAEPDARRSDMRRVQKSSTQTRHLYDIPHTRYASKNEIPYIVQEHLGAGGYGTVDRIATRNDPSTVVARKTQRFPTRRLEAMLAAVKNEIGIMQTLVHPHIERVISTYNVGTEKIPRDFSFIMLPVGEEDLKQYIERMSEEVPPDEPRRLEGWMMCLATAVAYMHSRQIRHRDIKPANIIRKGDMLYFIDFGSATDGWDSEMGTESDGSRQGGYTVLYTAPEVIAEEVRGLPADIFSLGAVFALMSTLMSRRSVGDFDNFRQTPSPYFPEETTRAFHSSIKKAENWLMRRQVASNKLIVQMLSKDPKDRPTALEVVSALRSINGFPTCDCVLRVSPP